MNFECHFRSVSIHLPVQVVLQCAVLYLYKLVVLPNRTIYSPIHQEADNGTQKKRNWLQQLDFSLTPLWLIKIKKTMFCQVNPVKSLTRNKKRKIFHLKVWINTRIAYLSNQKLLHSLKHWEILMLKMVSEIKDCIIFRWCSKLNKVTLRK
jgi:hypothetical protein